MTVKAAFQDVLEAADDGCGSCTLLRECAIVFVGPDIIQRVEDVEISVTYRTGTTALFELNEGQDSSLIELCTDQGI